MAARGSLTSRVREGPGAEGREVRRLLRVQRAVRAAALAPRPGPVPRREGGGPRPHPGTRGRATRRTRQRIAERFGIRDEERPADQWLHGHGALGLAHPHPDAPERRHQGPAVAGGRGRGGPGVRGQPARPAAGRPGGRAGHDRPGPGLPHRRQGRGDRRHRQGDSPPPPSIRTSRTAAGTSPSTPWPALAQPAPRRAHRHRQRHRLPGDRPAGRRPDQAPPGAQADQGRGVRGRRQRLLRVGLRLG